jgi:hypothetical protein
MIGFIKHDSFNMYLCIVSDDTLFPIQYKNQILTIFITFSLYEENAHFKFKKISKKV